MSVWRSVCYFRIRLGVVSVLFGSAGDRRRKRASARMGFVTVLWSVAIGFSLTIAAVSGFAGLVEYRNPNGVTLFVLSLALAASSFLELGLMHAATPSEYGQWLRWYHAPVFVAIVAQVLFVRYYLGTGRPWLLWTVIGVRIVVLVVNFSLDPNFNYSSIQSVRHLSVLGEQVALVGSATPRSGWQLVSLGSLFLMIVFLTDAAVQRWLAGGREARRQALIVGFGIAIPWLCTVSYTQSIVFGLGRMPISNLPWFLGTLIAITFELTRDYSMSRRALVELTGLQRQLMQQERVGVLGQLSSALAHQLIQPLTATTTNVVAGLKLLERDEPDRAELREILVDIGKDSRRATDVIAGMRQLIRSQPIALRPVRMEDVIAEAVALVREEVTARHVALALFIQPDLPRVLGDRVHLSQVLLNLLLNSVHAVEDRPPEARRVVVEARADAHKREVEVIVRDSGPGIPEDAIDKVFGLFFTTKPEGTGVGLALSRTIIEAHGGRLWLDRTVPQEDGTVFRFALRQA